MGVVTEIDPTRARSFGDLADAYDRARPGYPDEAVDWLVPPGARVVADVGAGTGKLTGSLLARGLVVEAVEPDGAMLAVLRTRHPLARLHEAPAERLPLATGSVDAVLVAQAWHWLRPYDATNEVRRVLRPGGSLGLVWNTPDPQSPWEFAAHGLDPATWVAPRLRVPDDDLPFPAGEVQTAVFAWTWTVTAEEWVATVATHSAVSTLPAPDRQAVLAERRAALLGRMEATAAPTVRLRHRAMCLRWTPGVDAT